MLNVRNDISIGDLLQSMAGSTIFLYLFKDDTYTYLFDTDVGKIRKIYCSVSNTLYSFYKL